MSKLTEKYIQKESIDYLEERYKSTFNIPNDKIFAGKEVRTKKIKGNYGRADGLICFNSAKQDEHLVSIEAKSHKTLGALLPFHNDLKFGKQIFIIFGVFALISIFFTIEMKWYWITLICICSGVISVFIYSSIAVLVEPSFSKLLGVHEQLKQYPANEQWIAISSDSINLAKGRVSYFYNKSNYENIYSICKSKGIGLIVVNRKKREIILEPKFQAGRFLKYYSIENKIRLVIN